MGGSTDCMLFLCFDQRTVHVCVGCHRTFVWSEVAVSLSVVGGWLAALFVGSARQRVCLGVCERECVCGVWTFCRPSARVVGRPSSSDSLGEVYFCGRATLPRGGRSARRAIFTVTLTGTIYMPVPSGCQIRAEIFS